MKIALLGFMLLLFSLGVLGSGWAIFISAVAWVLGLIGAINAISFWWVLTFVASFIVSILGVGTCRVLIK